MALSFLGQTHLCGYHCRIENRPRETFPPTHHPNPIGPLDSQITSSGTQPRHFQHSKRGQLLHLGRFLCSVRRGVAREPQRPVQHATGPLALPPPSPHPFPPPLAHSTGHFEGFPPGAAFAAATRLPGWRQLRAWIS